MLNRREVLKAAAARATAATCAALAGTSSRAGTAASTSPASTSATATTTTTTATPPPWFRRSPRVFLLDFQMPDPVDQSVPGMPGRFFQNLDPAKIVTQIAA